jgi:predicted ATP-binding protein involved in virulence
MFERYPESENPLAEPAIVLVDEIDLHLHPKWQRKLISYLTERFPNTQFIVTAHSPLIVQAAADANIVLLRQEGDHVVIDNDVEAIRGWRIDQVLTSDLFGLETARPPKFDTLLAERRKLLGKAKLTKKDEARLKKLEAEIGDLPVGETPDDIEAMDIIREAAAAIRGS